ncbi:Anti-sigma factor ChrR, cupin superfamily [Klebsiella quasipneumoniae]|uniref:cupin domain-containing protein n=1 Tax=Klebsiella TaxID=570 RepID=UPI0007CCC925|nr:cupin domain-containing protein [Klebsiella quasipneumoniae]AWX87607.1 anti-sigma factor [Klebsiella quasipneumoniae subsp. quasipneumoniae]MCB3857101.1 cupin domain-containing protein [Klebsiella quasipneumoniae]MCS6406063.1 cupin domain-containing protein [Klebsiella quasipneumoniae subsp. quasipneumoniae]PLM41506.1 anti-sigma factor [Klebsiella quasipneumoniae]QEY78615.1 anti-sigma factor [Klebsiella quasipneumoniae]
MLINHDFTQRVTVSCDDYHWVHSPQTGIDRVMLDRIGGEQARATSVVRYLPLTVFPQHQHPGGEEILVLQGQFSEGNRDYPTGWYLRNPPGSSHQPHSKNGTLLFVKLGQMTTQETVPLRIDTRAPENWLADGGMSVCPLFESAQESVCLLRIHAGALLVDPALKGGAELFIVEGSMIEGNRIHAKGSWIRIPSGQGMAFTAGIDNTLVYLKKGHLDVEQVTVP